MNIYTEEQLAYIFEQIGLEEVHATVYTYWLDQHEELRIQEAAHSLHIQRNKVYRVIEDLIEYGLGTYVNGIYTPQHPSKIKNMLKHQLHKTQSAYDQLDSLIKNWEPLYNNTIHQKVFQGIKAMIDTAYSLLADHQDTTFKIYNIGSQYYNLVKTDQRDYARERCKKNIFVQMLASENNQYVSTDENQNSRLMRSVKRLPAVYNNLPMVLLTEQSIYVWNFEAETVAYLNNISYAKLAHAIFDGYWLNTYKQN